jgi:hypothetical protein
MTENQKLRALLKEARESFASGESCAEARATGCDGSAERYAHEARHLHARIDAALAEQGDVDQDSFMLGANKMRTEIFWMLSSRYGRFGISETLQCAMEVRAMQLPKDGE